MKAIILISIIELLFFTQCKRDKEKDHVTQHDIKGMVYNNCTDSGLANVTVFLKDGQGLNESSVSDGSGNFVFPGVSIHDSNKYSYNIYIPSKVVTMLQLLSIAGLLALHYHLTTMKQIYFLNRELNRGVYYIQFTPTQFPQLTLPTQLYIRLIKTHYIKTIQ